MDKQITLNMNKQYNSSFAVTNSEAIRLNKEDTIDLRPDFFRDSDRIIYSLAYTRYINKTQVFSNCINDNISKRMTHVQMVSRIARTIGRALGLNEDLIEAAALGHDIGHAPFGHQGEAILNKISLENNEGFFNHNIQSVRNLMFIDKGGQGCNLTIQVLDAIMCHNGEIELREYKPIKKNTEQFLEEYYSTYKEKSANTKLIPMTLEGCVVRISDIIGYLGKDIEDAIRLHVLDRKEIPKELVDLVGSKNSEIINFFVNDIINNSFGKDYIKMSDKAYDALVLLKKFNYEHIYLIANSKEQILLWEKMFRILFDQYLSDLKNNHTSSPIFIYFYNYMGDDYKKNTSLSRVVIDYIAGMTDEFLLRSYKELGY